MSIKLKFRPDVAGTDYAGLVKPGNGGAPEPWADIRVGDAAVIYRVIPAPYINLQHNEFGWNNLARIFMTYDTSEIPTSAVIESAYIEFPALRLAAKDGALGNGRSLVIGESSPADASNIALTDWDAVGTVPLSATVSMSGLSLSAWRSGTFLLNAAGIDNIDLAGISKFALMLNDDLLDSEPAGEGQIWMLTQTEKLPTLNVTYSMPAEDIAPAPINRTKSLFAPAVTNPRRIMARPATLVIPAFVRSNPVRPELTPSPVAFLATANEPVVSNIPYLRDPLYALPNHLTIEGGDSGTPVYLKLRQAGDRPIPLGSAKSVTYHLSLDGESVVSAECDIYLPDEGVISLRIFGTDLEELPGEYSLELVIDWGAGLETVIPGQDSMVVLASSEGL